MVHFWKDNSHRHSVRLPALRVSQSQDHYHQMTTQKRRMAQQNFETKTPTCRTAPGMLINFAHSGETPLKRTQIRDGGTAVEYLKFDYLNWRRFNLLAPEFYISILAHTVCKMWIIQEPKKVALWNKQHFEEKNGECAACLKYSVLIFVEKNIYIKCNIWRVAVRPSYI